MKELGYTQCRVLTDMSGKARFPMGFAPVPPAAEETTHGED